MEAKKEVQEIKETLERAILKLSTEYQGSSLTDIFVMPDALTGELSVIDDEENLIVKEVISVWEERDNDEVGDDDSEPIDPRVLTALQTAVEELCEEGAFDELEVYKPFSLSIINDSGDVVYEILTIEDDSIVHIEDDIIERLEKDFDDFVDRILKE